MHQVIRLTEYHEKYDEALANFSLTGEQFSFTALPAEVIEEAISNPDKVPIVILKEETPVGFLFYIKIRIRRRKEIFECNLNKSIIHYVGTSGRGYARAAMQAIGPLLQQIEPGMKEVILAVNEQNVAAQSLYLKVGFRDTGIRRIEHMVFSSFFINEWIDQSHAEKYMNH